jgi:hypothetical protein
MAGNGGIANQIYSFDVLLGDIFSAEMASKGSFFATFSDRVRSSDNVADQVTET